MIITYGIGFWIVWIGFLKFILKKVFGREKRLFGLFLGWTIFLWGRFLLLSFLLSIFVNLFLRRWDNFENLAVTPKIANDALDNFTHKITGIGKHIDIVNQIRYPSSAGMSCNPEESPLERLGNIAQPFSGFLFTLNCLFVGKVALASYGARPNQWIAQNRALKKWIVIPKHLFGGFTVENFIVRLESRRWIALFERSLL